MNWRWYGYVSQGLAKHRENITTVHGLSETTPEAEYCTKFGYAFSQMKILTSRSIEKSYKDLCERLKNLIYLIYL